MTTFTLPNPSMRLEEDISDFPHAVSLLDLEEDLASRLSEKITGIRVVYRRDDSTHAMIVQWLFDNASMGIYQVLIEVVPPYEIGEDLWPFTLEEEMDLLQHDDERWDIERVFITGKGRNLTGTVIFSRYRNRHLPQ